MQFQKVTVIFKKKKHTVQYRDFQNLQMHNPYKKHSYTGTCSSYDLPEPRDLMF